MEYTKKEEKLWKIMEEYVQQDVCIAFSGGADSSLLLKLAMEVVPKGITVYAVTFDTVLHPSCDLKIAAQVAEEAGAVHQVLFVDELEDPGICSNPIDRCYRCKKKLFTELQTFAREKSVSTILEGTNADDLTLYRPGLLAVREMGIKSPLAEAGMQKEEVRAFSRKLGLSVADRPASPCLATRLPYGTRIEPELLRRIEEGETLLKKAGFPIVRLRVQEETARIEIPKERFKDFLSQAEKLAKALKTLGFHYVTLDLEGFRSGSMDEFLKK